jgi:hypothetical protein
MLLEIEQIKVFLAKQYNLPLEGVPGNSKVVGVPDCEHMIPIGESLTPVKVRVKDDMIHIDPRSEMDPLASSFMAVRAD